MPRPVKHMWISSLGTVAFQLSLRAWETFTVACGDIDFQSVTVAASRETCFILDKSGKGVKTAARTISTAKILHMAEKKEAEKKKKGNL